MIKTFFIQLTDPYDKSIWVNMLTVSSIRPAPDNAAHLYFVSGEDYILVNESPAQVIKLCREAEARARVVYG